MNDLFHHASVDELRTLVSNLEALKNIAVPQDNLLLQMALTTELDATNSYLNKVLEIENRANTDQNYPYFSKDAAIIAIERGYKVYHRTFTPLEFLKLSAEPDCYEDENGVLVAKVNFWMTKTATIFNTGWSTCEKID